MLLTSGSTAEPKLVVLSHRNILASTTSSILVNGYSADEISLNWLPLHHVGGLLRSIREVVMGCWQVQAGTEEVLRNPLLWLDWMDRYRVTLSWAPSFAFAMVVARREQLGRSRWDLRSVRSLYASAEPVVPSAMAAFRDLLGPCGLDRAALHVAWE